MLQLKQLFSDTGAEQPIYMQQDSVLSFSQGMLLGSYGPAVTIVNLMSGDSLSITNPISELEAAMPNMVKLQGVKDFSRQSEDIFVNKGAIERISDNPHSVPGGSVTNLDLTNGKSLYVLNSIDDIQKSVPSIMKLDQLVNSTESTEPAFVNTAAITDLKVGRRSHSPTDHTTLNLKSGESLFVKQLPAEILGGGAPSQKGNENDAAFRL